jgi:hypothetical protein
LAYLGKPATSANDSRLKFLTAWDTHEGDLMTNPTNGLAIEAGGKTMTGSKVSTFASVQAGYIALHRYLVNNHITGVLRRLMDPASTVQSLTQALAGANWEGSATPKARAKSLAYANTVGQNAGGPPLAPLDAAPDRVGGTNTAPPAKAPVTPAPVSNVPQDPIDIGGGGDQGKPAVPILPGSQGDVAPVTPTPLDPIDIGGGGDLGSGGVPSVPVVPGSGVVTPAPTGPVAPPIEGMDTQYTGPGAYKGFDLHSLAPDLIGPAKQAIDQFLSTPGAEQQVLNDIYTNYSQESWAASNPEVRTLLVIGSLLGWDKDPAIFEAQLQNTDWWKSTSDNQRNWQETIANDPGQARVAVREAAARVTNIANSLGVQLDASTLNDIATTVASQSVTGVGQFSNTQFTDQQIYQAVVGHFNSTDFLTSAQATSTSTPASTLNAASTATSTSGDAATLYNAFTTIARNYYLNLTPQQIAAKVQTYLQTDTGQGNFQSGAVSGFTTEAQQMAKTMYPALGSVVGTTGVTGTDTTPYAALAGYRNLIATYTGYGGDPDTIDMTSPQWSWILAGKQPPSATTAAAGAPPATPSSSSSATPVLPSYDQVQSYLMGTPQFQTTDLAKQMAWHVGSQITKAFGF